MTDEESIKSIVRKFAIKFYKNIRVTEKYVGVAIKSLGGLSNVNYIATIKDMTNNRKIGQLMFRKYGAISDCVDHVLEAKITSYLGKEGIGPNSYEEGESYRIAEYLDNTLNIEREKTFDNGILSSIYEILNLYNLFSYTYKFNVNGDKLFLKIINDGVKKQRTEVKKTQFENCMIDMYNKALKAFKPFAEEFRKSLKKENNEEDYMWLDKFEAYLNEYKTRFTDVYPRQGFVVMCHNDVHRLNFLHKKNESKLYCLDHEYANLNLPGNDLANYMNESNFNYEPDYFFTLDKVDFDKYYQFYQNYIELFISNHRFLEKEEGGLEFIKLIKTKKYYIKLHQILNLFWLLYCAIYLDYKEWIKDKIGSFYFLHGIHRLQLLEAGAKALEKCDD